MPAPLAPGVFAAGALSLGAEAVVGRSLSPSVATSCAPNPQSWKLMSQLKRIQWLSEIDDNPSPPRKGDCHSQLLHT